MIRFCSWQSLPSLFGLFVGGFLLCCLLVGFLVVVFFVVVVVFCGGVFLN